MSRFKLVLMASAMVAGLAGCAQAPQPAPEKPLHYEDPAVPPPPIAFTDQIRDVAVIETKGSRGGAALRAQEDLDVLDNSHYVGVEKPMTDENASALARDYDPTKDGMIGIGDRAGKNKFNGSKVDLGQAKNKSAKDKSIYRTVDKKDKSVYSQKAK